MNNVAKTFLIICFIASTLYSSKLAAASSNSDNLLLSIGVLAFRGEQIAITQWQPTIDYLNQNLDNITLELKPLDLQGIDRAIKNKTIAFVITNPGNYLQMAMKYGISQIASRLPRHYGSPEAVTGSTFFSLSHRDDLNVMTDFKNKSMMAVSPNAFGGFQIARHELMSQGIDPYADLKQLKFSQFPLDSIVYAVLNGEVDVGVVRSCLLEQMALEGKISLSDIKVINSKDISGFPCLTSSRLYPDWPLAKLSELPNLIAKEVTMALLSLPADSQAAKMSEAKGWTIPVNYQKLHILMQDLHIGAYGKHNHNQLQEFLRDYWQWFLGLSACLVIIMLHSWRVNRLVVLRTAQLTKANQKLHNEMLERQQANNKSKRHQAALAHVQRVSTLGGLASALAHELNQPLTAISSYAQGCIWRLKAGEKTDDFLDITERIAQQANRAGNVIAGIRAFLQKKPNEPKVLDINVVVSQALELFYGQNKTVSEHVDIDLATHLPLAWAEVVPIQQVLINLITNGLDAMAGLPMSERCLKISTVRQDEKMLSVRVKDVGTGIPTEIAERLFEPFLTTKTDGMGLGLSICHNLVAEQGGELTVLQNSDHGVVIGFTIPIYQGDEQNDTL